MNKNITLKGLPVTQNKQEFIIGKVRIEELLQFTKYTERVIIGYDEDEIPIYNNHIQRKVEQTRVNRIADFLINDDEATFPTNIVLGIPIQAISEQMNCEDYLKIYLIDDVYNEVEKAKSDSNADIYITVIDGQHRIRGIEIAINRLECEIQSLKNHNSLNETINNELLRKEERLNDLLSIELVVSYFIDKSLEYQAMIFSTINRTQKRVSQDLVYSLFGLSSKDTPYKTALEVTLALNSHKSSPFYKRIKLYGGDYKRGESPPLSQATMIKNIVSLISESLRESENDKYRKRKNLLNRTTNKFLPFRQFYANNQDNLISDCLFHYYNAIRSICTIPNKKSYWDYDGTSKPTNILQSTVGFEALLKILVDILKYEKYSSFEKSTFSRILLKIQEIDFADTSKYPMSTKGKSILYNTISLLIYPVLPDTPSDKDDRRILLNCLLEEL